MLRAVIFDMDGTLLDSEVIHYRAIQVVLERNFGFPLSMEEYLAYIGIPDPVMFPLMLRDRAAQERDIRRAEESFEELEREHWEEFYRLWGDKGIQSFPGVKELFEAIRKAGLKLALGTGSPHSVVDEDLEAMCLKEYVQAVATSEDCEHGKPAPDIFLKAAELLGVQPEECLVVEDSDNGLLAAERAGMCRVGFDGSQLPSNISRAPFSFSDYRKVGVEDFYGWYEAERSTVESGSL